jgi:hypothetical protein
MYSEELIKKADVEKIAKEGSAIYESLRSKYEATHKGEFLAIEVETKKEYLASSSAEAMVAARTAHPDKVFYVVKIGYDSAEAMAHLFPKQTNG